MAVIGGDQQNIDGQAYDIIRGLIVLSCLSQTHLWPLLVQTQGTQLLKLFIQIY